MSADLDWTDVESAREEWQSVDPVINRSRSVAGALEEVSRTLARRDRPDSADLDRVRDALDRLGGDEQRREALSFLRLAQGEESETPIASFRGSEPSIPADVDAVAAALAGVATGDDWSGVESGVETVLATATDDPEGAHPSVLSLAELFETVADAAVYARDAHRDELRASLADVYDETADVESGPVDPLTDLDDLPIALFPVELETRFYPTDETRSPEEFWVRIYPDAIHEDNHEPELTDREVRHGRRFWARLWLAAHAQTPTDSAGPTALDAYAELGVEDEDAAADYFRAGLDPDRLGWYLDVAEEAGSSLEAGDADRFHLADLAPDEVAHYLDAGAELDDVLELALSGLSPTALSRYADRWVLADDALEYHRQGLSPSTVEHYLAFDVAPPAALERHRQGLSPSLLDGYRSVGVDPAVAPTFYRAAIRPETVRELAGVEIDVEAIERYLEGGVPPVLVGHYLAADTDPEPVVEAISADATIPEEFQTVDLATELAELATAYADAGFGPSDGYDLADVYSFQRHGLSPDALTAYRDVGVEPALAIGYTQHGLEPDAIEAYDAETDGALGPELALGCALAGLSPEGVASYVEEGVTVATAYGLHLAGIEPDEVAAYRDAGVEPPRVAGFDRLGLTVDELERYAEAGLSVRAAVRYARAGYGPTEVVLDPEGGYLRGEPPRIADAELRELIASVDFSRFSSEPARRHEQLRDRAWGRLVNRLGERRAGYVVHALAPTDPDGEPLVDDLLTPPSDAAPPPLRFPDCDRRPSTWSKQTQIRLLPDRWAVVCEWEDESATDGKSDPPKGGGTDRAIRRRVVYGEAIPDPLPAGPSWTADRDDERPTIEEWVVDFDVAVDAGMGVRIQLSDDEFPGWTPSDGFRRVYVVGVKASMEPQETAAELVDLLDAHGATDGFEILEQGTQTNVDSPDPTGALDEEPTPVLPPRLSPREDDHDPALEYEGDGDLLARALGLDTERQHPFAYVPGADVTDQLDARHAHSALWPATLGYTLTHVLAPNALAGNPTLDDPDGEPPIAGVGELGSELLSGPLAVHDALREHFVRYVRGRGPLPPVRVGDQPYGVLPVKPTSDPKTAIPVLDPHVEEAIAAKRLTVPEATAAGASTEALVDSDLTTEQLVAADADPAELHGCGVDATELVDAGVDAGALRELDVSLEELSEEGVSIPELVSAGFEVVELERIGATIGDVAAAGADPRRLARAGASVAELAGYDLPVEEAIRAGFAARDLLEAGFTAADVISGGAPPSALADAALDGASLEALDAPAGTLKQAGVPADRLLESGYSARELLNGGYREAELGETGISLGDVEDAGRTAADAAAGGLTVEELRDHGYAAADLLADEYDVTGLFEAGYTTGELLDAGADVDELIDAGASVGALRAAGIDLDRLSSAGADPSQLREAGVAAAELADLPADELAEAGYTAAELADLEFTAEELVEAGYAPAELKDVGIDPAALDAVVDERAESLAAELFGSVGERSPTDRIRTVERRVDRVERELYSFGFDPATCRAREAARATEDLAEAADEEDLRSDGGAGEDGDEDEEVHETTTIDATIEEPDEMATVDDEVVTIDDELTVNEGGERSGGTIERSDRLDESLVAHDAVVEIRDVVTDDVDVDWLVERLVTGLQPYWSAAADELPYSDRSAAYDEESVLDALAHQAISQGGAIDAEVSQPAQLRTAPPSRGHVSRFDLPDDHDRWPALDAFLEAAGLDALDPRLSNTSVTGRRFGTPTIAADGMADDEIGAFLEHLTSVPSRSSLSVTDLATFSFHDSQLPTFDVEALERAGLSLEITDEDEGYPLARKNGPIDAAEETADYWDAMPRSWQAATVVALIEELATSDLDRAMGLVHDVIDEASTPAQRSFERSLEVAAKNAAREGEAMVPRSLARVLFQHAVNCEFAAARLRLGVRYDDLPAQGPDYSVLTANAGLAGSSLGGQATADLWDAELETDVVVDLYDDLVGVDDDWSDDDAERMASEWIHDGFRAHHGRGSEGSTDHQPLTYEWPLARAMAGTSWAVPIDGRMTEFGDSLAHLADCEPEQIATLTAEALDCCSHRLDAWWTSMATRRLYELREAQYEETSSPGCYVGAYGFVENCKPTPEDEPEFVHAPSVQQASTAAYLRGGYLAGEDSEMEWAPETDDEGTELPTEAGNPLAIDLSPERVHDARWLLDAVGKGHSLSELLGYEFERRMHEETLDPDGENLLGYRRALREVFPGVRDSLAHAEEAADPDESVGSAEDTYAQVGGEFADSDVLDGYALCKRWETPDEYDDWHRLPFKEALSIDGEEEDAPTPAFDGDEHDALTEIVDELQEDLDAVSDLLVAEGVHQLGKERPGAAGAALDALTAGSSFREATVTETKPPETGVAHRLFVLLEPELLPAEPVAPAPVTPSFADADDAAGVPEPIPETAFSARSTAEPTLESWARSLLPAFDDVGFLVREAGAPADAETVRLSALSIDALDLVALATDVEGRGLTELDRRLAYVLGRRPPAHLEEFADDVELELTDAGDAQVSVAAAIETARSLGAVIDGAEPAAADDLAHPEQLANSGYTAPIDDADRVRVSGGDERAPPASRATVEELAKRADRIEDQFRTIADRLAAWVEETDDGGVTDRVDDAADAIERLRDEGTISGLPAALDALADADLDAECATLADAIPPGPTDESDVDEAIVLEAAPDQVVAGTVGHRQAMPDEAALSSASLPWEAEPTIDEGDDESPSTVDVVVRGLAGAEPIVRESTAVRVDEDGGFETTIDVDDVPPGTPVSVVAVSDGSIVFAETGRVVGDAAEFDLADEPGLAALCWLVAARERLDAADEDAPIAALADAVDAIDPDELAAALGAFSSDRWEGPGTVPGTTVTDEDVETAAALATFADVDPTSVLALTDPVCELATAIGLAAGVELTGIGEGHDAATPYLAADGPGVETVATDDGAETEIPLGRSALRARLERVESDGWHAASDGESLAGRLAGFDPDAAGLVADADEPAVLAAALDALARAPPWLAVALDDDGVSDAHATLASVADWTYAASELDGDALADVADAFDELADRDPVEDYLGELLGEIDVSVAVDGLEWLAELDANGDEPADGDSLDGLVDERLTASPSDVSLDDDTAMAAVDSFVATLESADGAENAVRRAVCERVREPLLAASIAGIDGAAPRVPVGARERDERALRTQADLVSGSIRDRLEAAAYESGSGRYETVDRQVARERSRIDALVDGEVPVLPPFAPTNPSQLSETFASLNGLGDGPEPDYPHQGETWLQRVAQVRDRPAELREALSYAESLTGDWHRELLVGQLPAGEADEWVGAEGVVPERGSLSLVAQFGPQADGGLDPTGDLGWVAGLAVDTWVESVPQEELSTGVAVRYDEPGTEPPQSVLLSVPREDGDWSLERLVGSVSESMCYARHRSVDLEDLGELGAIDVEDETAIQPALARTLVPGLYFPQGGDAGTLAVNLDSFEVYDSIEDLVSLEFDGQPIMRPLSFERYDVAAYEVEKGPVAQYDEATFEASHEATFDEDQETDEEGEDR